MNILWVSILLEYQQQYMRAGGDVLIVSEICDDVVIMRRSCYDVMKTTVIRTSRFQQMICSCRIFEFEYFIRSWYQTSDKDEREWWYKQLQPFGHQQYHEKCESSLSPIASSILYVQCGSKSHWTSLACVACSGFRILPRRVYNLARQMSAMFVWTLLTP